MKLADLATDADGQKYVNKKNNLQNSFSLNEDLKCIFVSVANFHVNDKKAQKVDYPRVQDIGLLRQKWHTLHQLR